MKVIVSGIINKFKAIFNRKNSFSSLIIDSTIDKTVAVRQSCRIYHCNICRYTYFARNTLAQNVQVGSFCSISEDCNIGMPSHPTDMVSTSPIFLEGVNYLNKSFATFSYNDCPRTNIGNDVWIGASAKIKSGVNIGNGAIIAAGAVVTYDVPPYAIVGGVPAKVIRYRFDEDTIKKLQESKWWDLPEDELRNRAHKFNDVSKYLSEK